MGFWLIAFWVASTILQYLIAKALAPKVAKRGPGELQAPVCEQGYPIPVLYGTAKVKGGNVVWNNTPTPKKRDKVQYNYWCDMQLAWCHGGDWPVDRIRRIWIGTSDTAAAPKILSQGTTWEIVNPTGVETAAGFTVNPPRAEDVDEGTVYIVGSDPVSVWDPDDPDYPYYNNWDVGNPKPKVYPTPDIEPPPLAQPTPLRDWLVKATSATYRGSYWEWYEPSGYIKVGTTVYEYKGESGWVESEITNNGCAVFSLSKSKGDSGLEYKGRLRFWHGGLEQQSDAILALLQDRDSGDEPSFGGLCYGVLHGPADGGSFWWGSSPSLPDVAVELERCPNPLGFTSAQAAIDLGVLSSTVGDLVPSGRVDTHAYAANPANILYDLLVDATYGLGVATEDIDTATFRDAGRILASEEFGMSILVDQQGQFDDVAGDILKTVDGVLFVDTSTGQWVFRLIRDAYTSVEASALGLETTFYSRTDWLEIDESMMLSRPEFSRGSLGDVATEIKVQYIDPTEAYAQRIVQVQDIANFQTIGSPVSVSNVYNGVNTRELAIRLAYRDLRSVGAPRARLKVSLNRKARSVRPGDCIAFSYGALGVVGMVMRVATVSYGTLADGRIEIEAIEDMFSMPDTVYQEPGSGWINPDTVDPVAPTAVRLWEIPYDLTGDGPRVTAAVLAVRGDEYTSGARLWASVANGPWAQVGEIDYTPSAILSAALAVEERTAAFTLQGAVDLDGFEAATNAAGGQNLLLVDGELIAFQTLRPNEDGTWMVSGAWRGVYDTIPRTHALGSRVWIVRDTYLLRDTKETDDHDEIAAVQAWNQAGELDVNTQPRYGIRTASRSLLPLVPGKFRVGSTDLPGALADRLVTGSVEVSWRNRDRSQGQSVVPQDADSTPTETVPMVSLRRRSDAILPLLKTDGTTFPFGSAVDVGSIADAASSLPWARTSACTYWGDSGVVSWSEQILSMFPAMGSGTGTKYVGWARNPSAGLVLFSSLAEVDAGGYGATLIPLYQFDWAVVSGRIRVTVTDLRGPSSDQWISERSSGSEAYDVEPDGFDGVVPGGPVSIALWAETDGSNRLRSMEERVSGLLYPVGYGMAYGMSYGGE